MRDPQPVRPGADAAEAAAADLPEPLPLRRLRRLVSLLTAVLILGTVTVSGALVIRLGGIGLGAAPVAGPVAAPAFAAAIAPGPAGAPGPAPAPAPIAAAELVLPEGEAVTALGRAGGEVLVLTRDAAGLERLRAFDAATGAPRSVTPLRREAASGGGDGPAR